MTIPYGYRHATKDWQAFLADARSRMDLTSDNATFTAVEAVLKVFRARLTVAQALAFAEVLPAVLRALFVSGWVPAAPLPWPARAVLEAEAQGLRPDHNLTPANAIEATAFALRRHVRQRDLDRVLQDLGPEATGFWHSTAPAEALRRPLV